MNLESFAVFILTHGRPDNVVTYTTLRKQGYTGAIYLVVDNEDATLPAYQRLYGEQVVVFDKADIAARFDTGDNQPERRSVFFARNASFEIARSLGLTYFLQLDDDYAVFHYKFTPNGVHHARPVHQLDRLFTAFLAFYASTPALTLAMAQMGDFQGGAENSTFRDGLPLLRKAMNTFFCSPTRPFAFVARVNEDVATYTSLGNRGNLVLTVPLVAINQTPTQHAAGGMSDLYQAEGTYVKSFYPVLYCPSFVRLRMMGNRHARIHHQVQWAQGVPRLLNARYKKSALT